VWKTGSVWPAYDHNPINKQAECGKPAKRVPDLPQVIHSVETPASSTVFAGKFFQLLTKFLHLLSQRGSKWQQFVQFG
jgi:hypothetical protein